MGYQLITIVCCIVFIAFPINNVFAQTGQIHVSAQVSPQSNSAQIDIVSLNTASEVPQDTFMDFEVTYGSFMTVPINLTLEVEGHQGIIEGSGAPSIDIVNYVYGSASNAINDIPPVIDPIHKKIIWNIVAFPANTNNKKVRFTLRTNSAYTGSSKVNFAVAARLIGPGFVTPDKIVTKTYKYNSNQAAQTSTSSQITTATAPTVSTKTTTQTYVNPFSKIFKIISVPIVSQNDAKIFISTYSKYFYSIRYGPTSNRLTDKISSLSKTENQALEVTDLAPDTTYYFKAEVKDEKGIVTGTETFTFKTAEVSDKPEVEKSSLIVTSQSNFLAIAGQTLATEDGAPKPQNPSIVIPKDTPYEIRFAVKKRTGVKKVQAIVRNKTVLGISTAYAQDPNTEVVDMVEVEHGIYVGSLTSKLKVGYYEQLVRIEDLKGNINEEKIADIKVLNNFNVRSYETKEPLEGAKVLISLYNPKTKLYQIIPPNIIPIENPSYTDSNGEIKLVLPQGKYKAEVSSLGHKDKAIEFTIGANADDGFPTVYLEKGPFSILYFVRYLWRASLVFAKQAMALVSQVKTITESTRLFNLIGAVIVPILILLGLLSLRVRTHMTIFSLMRFILFHSKRFLPQNLSHKFFFGLVLDGSHPVSQANIFLLDDKENRVVDQTQSNDLGEFYLRTISHPVTVMAIKKGYEPAGLLGRSLLGLKKNVILRLKKREALRQSVFRRILRVLENILGLSFEFIIVATIILEIFFAQSFGIVKTAPFIAISMINFLIWLFYIKQKLRRKPALS